MTTMHSITQGITQSLMIKYIECPRKYLYACQGYEINDKAGSIAIWFGNTFHNLIDNWYSNKNNKLEYPIELAIHDRELILAVSEALFKIYKQIYKKPKNVNAEYKFNSTYYAGSIKIPLLGKIDAVLYKDIKKTLPFQTMETKTKSQIPEGLSDYLPNNFQNLFYIWALGLHEATNTYDIIRFPRYKESNPQKLFNRIETEVQANQEHFFQRHETFYCNSQVNEFGLFMKKVISDIIKDEENNSFKKTYNCMSGFNCPYIHLCTKNSKTGLYKKKVMFTELE